MKLTSTEKEIRANFPGPGNKSLRAIIRRAAQNGSVMTVADYVALTTVGVEGLKAVQATIEPAPYDTLVDYAEAQIAALRLGDTPTNCNGVVAHPVEGGSDAVRLSDGVGLDVVCRTKEEVDRELSEVRD